MNPTTPNDAAQACTYMHLYLKVLGDMLRNYDHHLPASQVHEIVRLQHAMWHEIAQAKQAVLFQNDESFLRFKAKVVKMPRKNSKLWRELHG